MFTASNKSVSKYHSPSAINIHSININALKKNISTQRITSAINSPLIYNNHSNLNSKQLFKANSTNFHFNTNRTFKENINHRTIETNFSSKNFSFNTFIKSPLSIKSSNMPESKVIIKKNKKIFGHFLQMRKDKCEEENKKIQSVLSELVIFDNKQLIENNDTFKAAKIFCEKEKERLKTQKKYTEKNQEFNDRKSGWLFSDDGSKTCFEQKFSVFDKNYDMKKYKNEEEKKKEKIIKEMKDNLENNLKKVNHKNSILESQKEKIKFEDFNKDQLIKIYKYILSNKLKKKKYKEIIESAFNLLNQGRVECKLSVDLLKERIKSLQKYYETYIESMGKLNKGNDSERRKLNNMEKYEEKINKYREYLSIYEDINKEIKTYENKYNIVKKDLGSFINEIKEKIEKINDEINQFQYLFNELKDQQIEYYFEKLKKGVDTRYEGLSWIVKKLMELKTSIKPDLFPNFLDQEQINYIIQISKLGFESNQLKQILKNLKDKKNNLMDNLSADKNKNILKNKKILRKEIKDNGLAEDINFEIDFKDCFEELIKEKGEINKKITSLQEKFSKKEGISPVIKIKI